MTEETAYWPPSVISQEDYIQAEIELLRTLSRMMARQTPNLLLLLCED